jgi:hypothetical protein
MKVNAARATVIASVNAIVRKLLLGAFMSEYTITEYTLKVGAFAGNGCFPLHGRTTEGELIESSSVVVYKKDAKELKGFPIEKVYVTINDPYYNILPEHRAYIHFECTLDGSEIQCRQMSSSPHEIIEEPKPPEPQREEDLLL